MKTEILNNIIKLLNQKEKMYAELSRLSDKERKCYMKIDSEMLLWDLMSKKQEKIKEIISVRKEIISILNQAKIANDFKVEDFDISKLKSFVPQKQKSLFLDILQKLNLSKKRVYQIAKENKNFVSAYLKIIKNTTSFITSAATKKDTYENKNYKTKKVNVLLNQEA